MLLLILLSVMPRLLIGTDTLDVRSVAVTAMHASHTVITAVDAAFTHSSVVSTAMHICTLSIWLVSLQLGYM